jgi:hypothetical protein
MSNATYITSVEDLDEIENKLTKVKKPKSTANIFSATDFNDRIASAFNCIGRMDMVLKLSKQNQGA